ncbi:acetoacetyl-CoA reductase [Caballeronia calidae]|uniref:Acetoacetyl-CoA reductase n=1 Tax=Caballeronia calidae TaxID=1777139 RepID=A0A158E4H3_9BURK|nr:SDR family oxidoreductase [Caballeronia calidae]SAL01704.1 acetoacetyl-CoA reductase [Caballeronia calidae]
MSKRVAVVIGGARGIGWASCLRLAPSCDSIAILDVDGARAERAACELKERFGIRAMGLSVDVTVKEKVAAAREKIADALGTPKVLVNCAALVDDKRFLESTEADWDRILSVCLYGTMNALHEFLPAMSAEKYGRVVCLASDSGKIGQAKLSYYAAAKGAVIALVKSLAQELGRDGVTLNIVSPGATNTEMRNEREDSLRAQMGEEAYERRKKAVLKAYPLGRLGEPDDIGAAVGFLCSDDASWITGQTLSVNGGFTMA